MTKIFLKTDKEGSIAAYRNPPLGSRIRILEINERFGDILYYGTDQSPAMVPSQSQCSHKEEDFISACVEDMMGWADKHTVVSIHILQVQD